jgi:hypothetical protein
MSDYVETAADHTFTAFLAHLTPGKVLRDREANFSKQERKRQIFLRQKSTTERKARVRFMFTPEQIELAQRVLAEQNKESK